MARLSREQIIHFDKTHLWHPYAKANSSAEAYPVASAQGVKLTLSSGEILLDGMASWWSAIHGYNHPELNAAVAEQMRDMAHVMFGGLTHEPAARLAKTLADISPGNLSRVFLSDSGSVAVEVAMKMAIQYCHAKGQHRSQFLTLAQGYHGDTFAAMSVCDPIDGMHTLFSGMLIKNEFAKSPKCLFHEQWEEHYFDDFLQKGEACKNRIAAVILEPIVQAAGGMKFYSPRFLQRVSQWCSQNDILLIADEIATGFARTGKLFACEHANITPDIMCLGKALTGGYLTLAATLCSDQVASTICMGQPGIFMHGPTFMANPLACAVANKSIELLLNSDWQNNSRRIEQALQAGLQPCTQLPKVVDVRVLGAIGVIELDSIIDINSIQPLLIKNGLWLRPFGKLLYTMPSYICSNSELAFLCERMFVVLEEYIRNK